MLSDLRRLLPALVLAAALAAILAGCSHRPARLSDEALLDSLECLTIRYFTDFAEPSTGMARERDNHPGGDIVTTGGTGFGIMALIAGAERGWVPKEAAISQLERMVDFLGKDAERFHGAWAHWYDGKSHKVFNFSKFDDGGDLVETAFLTQGLLAARQWLRGAGGREKLDTVLAARIDTLWRGIDWQWYTRGTDSLYWHWSGNYGWKMNHRIKGYDETLITYVLAASSPTHPISRRCYEASYKTSDYYYNGKEYYGIPLSLGMEYGGPLFFCHYSFLGLDPRGLSDGHTDYFERNRAHSLIHYEYAKANPGGHKELGDSLWGFTSSDDALLGYTSHHPGTPDENGTVSPTAAVSSIVYTPEESMKVVRYLYDHGAVGPYGFYDAYNGNLSRKVLKHYLAIDQGPQAVMLENRRSGLLWELFMSCPEVKEGLAKLGFTYNN